MADAALAFLANKGGGKSTLATAMCAGGATLITDDMLPLTPEDPVMAWPSMPAVRLLHDSASHLRYASGPTHPATNKYHVNELPSQQVERRRLPVGAIYELAPVPAGVTLRRAKKPDAADVILLFVTEHKITFLHRKAAQ